MSSFLSIASPNAARRLFLGRSGLVLSGSAVALLAGRDVLAAKSKDATAGDVRILNTALGAELEAIAAYQAGAESGLLQKPVLVLAVQFQGQPQGPRRSPRKNCAEARRQAGRSEE